MANVLVNDEHLYDIADAIRAKNGEDTLYKPEDMADAISAITTGGGGSATGSGGLKVWPYRAVGAHSGLNTNALSFDLPASSNDWSWALIVVMHRSSVSSVPNDFIAIDTNRTYATDMDQNVSIYKYQLQSSTSSLSITFGSSARCACSIFIFSGEPFVTYTKYLNVTNNASYTWGFALMPTDHQSDLTLAVINCVYTNENKLWPWSLDCTNQNLSDIGATPLCDGDYIGKTVDGARHMATVLQRLDRTLYWEGELSSSTNVNNNFCFVYKVESTGGGS